MNTNTPNPADVAPPPPPPPPPPLDLTPSPAIPCENASGLVIETTLKGYPIYRGPVLPKTNHNSRRSRYPLDELEVGQYFFLATEKEVCAVRSAAYVMKRKGSEKQFSVTAQVSNETGQLQWVAQRIA